MSNLSALHVNPLLLNLLLLKNVSFAFDLSPGDFGGIVDSSSSQDDVKPDNIGEVLFHHIGRMGPRAYMGQVMTLLAYLVILA
ncbi:hypothetical protein BKA63DRAFT_511672 [Paraphoma chrysanthemicola]|nr:hypothetical protein BKA63DRAFT_511672 [Paraphoma chrysanthemicola]